MRERHLIEFSKRFLTPLLTIFKMHRRDFAITNESAFSTHNCLKNSKKFAFDKLRQEEFDIKRNKRRKQQKEGYELMQEL